MYDLPERRDATDAVWSALGERLRDNGLPAPDTLDRNEDYHAPWHAPHLVFSQTCGWPLVTSLDARVEVVGAFAYDVPSADGARYRSLLVTRAELSDRPIADLARLRAAVNHGDSLSGWVSLLRGVGAPGSRWPGRSATIVGAHVASLAALQRGEADIACIDSVTWALLSDVRPSSRAGLVGVGQGPVIPCPPLITALGGDLAATRRAVAAVFEDARAEPALASALRALRITAFHPVGWEHYETARALGPA